MAFFGVSKPDFDDDDSPSRAPQGRGSTNAALPDGRGETLIRLIEEAGNGERDLHRRLDRSRVQLGEKVGEGAFGKVYKTSFDNQVAACKVLNTMAFDQYDLQCLRREIAIMSIVKHPNLLTCLAANVEAESAWIVMPFLSKGAMNVDNLKKLNLPVKERLRMVRDACNGMTYLEEHRIIHRDLKPDNILLDQNNNVFVADYGLARAISQNPKAMHRTTRVGTPIYMAPEMFNGKHDENAYGSEVDMHSFAIIIWEVATLDKPYPDVKKPFQLFTTVVEQKKRPSLAKIKPSSLAKLLPKCWDPEPRARITFRALLPELDVVFHQAQ
jgi:serine/threonine protein kinase